jgi:hypothetical protein
MFNKIALQIALSFMILSMTACGSPAQNGSAKPTLPVVQATATEQVDVPATQTVVAQASATAEAITQATANANATQTAIAQATATYVASQATQVAATAEVEAKATSQAQSMYAQIQALAKDKEITSTDGKFTQLADYEKELAMINYVWTDPLDNSPTNFVLTADTSWDVDSAIPNTFDTGCGFAFHGDQRGYYFVFLALDGNVYLSNVSYHKVILDRYKYYDKVGIPRGKAQVMLVVDNDKFMYYVNGKKVLTYQDNYHPQGTIGYSLLSGTNSGFGTRCDLTNVQLWELP